MPLGGGHGAGSDKWSASMKAALVEYRGIMRLLCFIHPIHRFKSSHWSIQAHMTWISFDNVHVRKLIHVLVFTISPALKEAVTAAEFGTFAVRYRLKNL